MAAEKTSNENAKSIPHFWNLNEDPALSGMILRFCKPGKTNIGSAKATKAPEIQLNGLG